MSFPSTRAAYPSGSDSHTVNALRGVDPEAGFRTSSTRPGSEEAPGQGTAARMVAPEDVLTYWFGPGPRPQPRFELWFGKSPEADAELSGLFGETLEAASRGLCDGWAATRQGRLALVLVLDQFSRQIFRGTPRMFAQDERARALVYEGLAGGIDREYGALEAGFFYLPLEHSESLDDQRRSVACFEALHARAPSPRDRPPPSSSGSPASTSRSSSASGTSPTGTRSLGRPSTPEELAFLQEPDSSF